jgi:tetratricopeptide (TPR) repeat protein
MDRLANQHTFELAQEHHQAGRLREAEQCYRQILADDPAHAAAIHYLGVIAHHAGQLEEAAALIRQAIQLNPGLVEAHCNFGNVLKDQKQFDDAVAAYRQAIALRPTHAESHNNLGNAFKEMGRIDEAIAAYRRAIELRPGYHKAHNNLGVALAFTGQFDGAIAAYRQALSLRPDYIEAMCNLGVALHGIGEYAQAIDAYQQVITIQPDDAKAYSNLGASFCASGRIDQAIESYRRALTLQPDFAEAHHNLALVLLLTGQFAPGWVEYEWRWRWNNPASPSRLFSRPQWDGSPLAGRTLLLHGEQGLGDTLQFARYVPLIAQRGGRVLFECAPELVRLMRGSRTINSIKVIPHTMLDESSLPPFDVHAPLMSLPLILNLPKPTEAPKAPYILVDDHVTAPWKGRLAKNGRLRVGLARAGSSRHSEDHRRSIPMRSLTPLLDCDADFYRVQPGQVTKQTQGESALIDLTSHIVDFFDTAGLISQLDLLISVDTAVAHLAAAMGKPTWVLLAHAPDWRWQLDRDDCDWYASVRIFRQSEPGGWDAVIARVSQALREEVSRASKTADQRYK